MCTQILPDRARRPQTLEPLRTAVTGPSATPSDGIVLHGMQKVRGSNPLSSTGFSDVRSIAKCQAQVPKCSWLLHCLRLGAARGRPGGPRLDGTAGRLRQQGLIGHAPARLHYGHRGLTPWQQPLQPSRGVHPDVAASHNQYFHDERLSAPLPLRSCVEGVWSPTGQMAQPWAERAVHSRVVQWRQR